MARDAAVMVVALVCLALLARVQAVRVRSAQGMMQQEGVYGNEVCIENKVAGDIKFNIYDSAGNKVGGYDNYATGKTKCSSVSSTSGNTLSVKVAADLGTSGTISPTFSYGDCKLTYKCTGTVDNWTCELETYCTTPSPTSTPAPTTAPPCDDPELEDVTVSNVVFTPGASAMAYYVCDNTLGEGTLTCLASYTLAYAESQTVTLTATVGLSESVSIKFKVGVPVENAEVTASATFSETFTESVSKTVTTTSTISSTCSVTLSAGECETLDAEYVVGTLSADYTATVVCADGTTGSGSGTLIAGNVAATTEITTCTANSTSALCDSATSV